MFIISTLLILLCVCEDWTFIDALISVSGLGYKHSKANGISFNFSVAHWAVIEQDDAFSMQSEQNRCPHGVEKNPLIDNIF